MLLHSSVWSPANGSAALPPAPTPDDQLWVGELPLLHGEQCAEALVSQQKVRALERNACQVPAVAGHLLQGPSQDYSSTTNAKGSMQHLCCWVSGLPHRHHMQQQQAVMHVIGR